MLELSLLLPDPFAETRVYLEKTITAYWWMFGICVLTMLVLVVVLVQVVRTTKCTDPVYLLMLFFLQLTMAANLYFFMY